MYGYLLGAALMIAAGIVGIVLGVEAAQRPLEDIAKPLTAEDAEARDDDAAAGEELDLDKVQGEAGSPVESQGDGRFDRDAAGGASERPRRARGGEE
jgi:hypothetical protein